MYQYSEQKKLLFTEEGQVLFMRVRDKVKDLLHIAGAFTMGRAIAIDVSGIAMADSWSLMACVDRLVELQEIRELTGPTAHGQNRTFVKCGG
jgi:hypothetical protein